MNILVTGATGFIGQALCNYLAKNQYNPYVLVRRPSTNLKAKKQFVVDNFQEYKDWNHVFKDINTVVHTAGLAHVKSEDQNFYDVNFELTKKLALECINAGVKRFVFLSSMAVYGKVHYQEPVTLSTPLLPKTAYAHSKLQAEEFLLNLHVKGDLEVIIIRPPVVYGPQCPGNVNLLIKAIKHNIPLPFAGIKNLRSLIYVDNLCHAIMSAALSPHSPGNVFLVSDSEDVSIKTLIQSLAKGLNKSAKLFPFPASLLGRGLKIVGKEDMLMKLIGSFQIDISDIQQKLNWKPIASVQDGLLKTAHSFLKI